ncbi:MAG: transporter substrate-binding domain-containing protein [Anaerostipes sp.]|jgi:ABC-type amino acid transport substrate-binding protein|nr:transporter substrate-binding domain-containing protein [Anaerostipes sp.]MDD3745491.1 transporter substrate-binding domain-containing protein [Anaerostipes sp.]
MKRLVTVCMALVLVFSLAGCTSPFTKKEDTKKENVKKTKITSKKVKNSMKGTKLKIGVSAEMPPFSYKSKKDGKIVGFDIDLIDGISKYLGFEYELVPSSMADISKKIKSGELDCAIAGISRTDKRLKEFTFSDEYYENSIHIMVNKNSKIEERKDIKGKKIGVEDGTANAEYVETYLAQGNKVKKFKNMDQIYKALEKGKIDATLYDATGVDYYLKEHKNTNIVDLEENLSEEESNYGIMFKKGYKKVDEFNVALQEMTTQGDYQKIENKWIESNNIEE